MNNTPSQHETARRTSQGSSGSPGFSGEYPTWAREPRATVLVATHGFRHSSDRDMRGHPWVSLAASTKNLLT
jgi:hypothetical protein